MNSASREDYPELTDEHDDLVWEWLDEWKEKYAHRHTGTDLDQWQHFTLSFGIYVMKRALKTPA